VILAMITRPLLPLALLVSVFLLLRGHDLPGGGFAAGLLTAVALIVQYMGSGAAWAERRATVDFRRAAAIGVLLAAVTGAASWLFGRPFLTSAYGYLAVPGIGKVGIGSALAFDIGVYLTVVGVVMVILERLGRLSRSAPDGPVPEERPWKR
jgi:multicomponent K+:H+ antiporter subunit A